MIKIELGATYDGMDCDEAAKIAFELRDNGMPDEMINEMLEHYKDDGSERRMKMEEETANNMDLKAISIVEMYIREHLDKSDRMPEFEVYTVWKCKTLQNWKYLLASTLFDGMYYELTYNGDKDEWYLDAYKKFENRRIKEAGKR